ncbi:aminoacyl-tRNA hydrolase [Patescibacteria group bacterium]|nr:aminoacyl-tRNA hydrolase [Patescibacteria group bacterium]MBU1448949.1 aminoacyl-tRNA hydrolase [Patescibacteria group bacterium]MBU2613317.1 aminoacyl-tRNA hydrolase [Patescibacteria group bacterium]
MMNVENPFRQESPLRTIPEAEMDITFARSSGPGGQKVNKTSSKAVVRWNVDASPSFSDEEKERLREKLKNRITKDGDIVIACMQERSQLQNRITAVTTLRKVVFAALEQEKERIGTKPSRGAKERRLQEKKQRGEAKRGRRAAWDE